MAALGPAVGSYSMLFTSSASVTYASDGLGATTATEEDSFVVNAQETVITGVSSPVGVAGALDFFHFTDGGGVPAVQAASMLQSTTQTGAAPVDLLLRGNWSVSSTAASGEWTILFKVIS